MVLWFSKSPANVRDGWCVPQKTADVRGQLILYSYLLPMPMTLIIDYYYFKLYTTTLHHYSSLIIATPSYALLHYITTYHWLFLPWAMYWYIMIKTTTHAETRLIFAIDHYFTHCPRAYCKKLQHRYIELAKREIHWDKDNILRIWGRNAITLQLYRKRSKLWGPDN